MARSNVTRFTQTPNGFVDTTSLHLNHPGTQTIQSRAHGNIGLGAPVVSSGLFNMVVLTGVSVAAGALYTLPKGAGYLRVTSGTLTLEFAGTKMVSDLPVDVATFVVSNGVDLKVYGTGTSGGTFQYAYASG